MTQRNLDRWLNIFWFGVLLACTVALIYSLIPKWYFDELSTRELLRCNRITGSCEAWSTYHKDQGWQKIK